MQNGDTKHIWKLLDLVPDPEIPVISVVELGVIRDITFADRFFTILITPTYSGCPAVKTFTDDIKKCLKENGIRNFKIKLIYSPAWTTEWMTEKTKKKLKKYGIAPPGETVVCPQCNSKKTQLISQFGATACKAMYKCSDCLEPFEFFKCI
ncbi:MAG: phenylacetate-CoA oxygenase subunit PaaJ [Flavobacteriales bacterium]|nr:phenylacetate-CoA oxygenase subunit PaaJ [Flavobacteriales bacterium]|tara:strand:+ start:8110 stop:8562 length:453 start_codon:yes stop_codon:yes gene_type:complete